MPVCVCARMLNCVCQRWIIFFFLLLVYVAAFLSLSLSVSEYSIHAYALVYDLVYRYTCAYLLHVCLLFTLFVYIYVCICVRPVSKHTYAYVCVCVYMSARGYLCSDACECASLIWVRTWPCSHACTSTPSRCTEVEVTGLRWRAGAYLVRVSSEHYERTNEYTILTADFSFSQERSDSDMCGLKSLPWSSFVLCVYILAHANFNDSFSILEWGGDKCIRNLNTFLRVVTYISSPPLSHTYTRAHK